MGIRNWEKKKLSSLCHRIGDGLHGTPTYDDSSDIFFVNGNNLKDGKILLSEDTKRVIYLDFDNNYIELNANSLLMSINGTLGNLAFYNGEKIMLGKSASYLNFKTAINKFYYYYFQLKDVQQYFYNVATGSTIKNLGLKAIQDFEVPVPSDTTWSKIAKVLSDLDAKIELNNKINAELEGMAKLIYDYWFVQFDFPNKEGKPYKSSGGKMVYNEELKREIPLGWEVKELSEVADFKNGKGIGKSEIDDSGKYSVFGSNGVIGKTNNLLFEKPVIAIGRVGANYGVVNYSLIPCWISDNAVTSQPKEEYYFWWLLQSLRRINYKNIAGGSAQPLITQGKLKSLKFPFCDTSVLLNFHSKVNPLLQQYEVLDEQNQQLASLRDWLLPMLMNGQVTLRQAQGTTVKEAEEHIDMAAEPSADY